MIYKIPKEYFFRIHHIRPRFINEVESILLYIANSIGNIGKKPTRDFNQELVLAVRSYPGNLSKTEKTIQNWRTEISALFGLIESDTEYSFASRLTKKLNTSGDLIEFFRHFLFTFQYPGKHLKPREAERLAKEGVKFHPAACILKVLLVGTDDNEEKRYGISKVEATHHIFNDLRVTRDGLRPLRIYRSIQLARKENCKYNSDGDVVRYAGDILNYLVLADLLDHKSDGKYYPKMQNLEVIKLFLNKKTFFEGYNQSSSQKELTQKWFVHLNKSVEKNKFSANVRTMFAPEKLEINLQLSEIKDYLENISAKGISTKQIGDLGENIVIEYEKRRLLNAGYEKKLVKKVIKLPNHQAMGYDIRSFSGVDGDTRTIHIEVKSTVSKNPVQARSFTITPNEWKVASEDQDLYFIYRLLIYSSGVKLFVIKNPVRQYKDETMSLFIREGATITYTEDSGEWHEVSI